MFQGRIKLAYGQHPRLPRRPAAPMSWWILEPARSIRSCTSNVDPFCSESLCSIPCAAIQCVLSVCGESFFPRGTCNRLLSGRELSHVAWRVHCFAGPPLRPLAWSPIIASCLWLSAGLPTIPSARNNSSHAYSALSFVLLAGVSVIWVPEQENGQCEKGFRNYEKIRPHRSIRP